MPKATSFAREGEHHLSCQGYPPPPTRVKFIGEKDFKNEHNSLSHRGEVIASLRGGEICEIKLELPSNPRFTARVMLAYAKAVFSHPSEFPKGALTPLDIPPSVFDKAGAFI